MPDLSGEQLFERLRSHDPSHAERVIFTTGDLVRTTRCAFTDGTRRPLRLQAHSSSLLSIKRSRGPPPRVIHPEGWLGTHILKWNSCRPLHPCSCVARRLVSVAAQEPFDLL